MSPTRSTISIMKQTLALVASLVLLICLGLSSTTTVAEAKLLRRSRIYDDGLAAGGYGYGGGAVPTGERAILTVRGTRNPYDGSAPSKIAIEDNPYRGSYPRGVYDRLDGGYNRGHNRYPIYPQGGYNDGYGSNYGPGGYGGYGGNSGTKRRDFLDPDFGFKAKLNLASEKQRNKCRINTEADSEIPELGLDSGNLNIDCDINPTRVADAALRVARNYGDYKRKNQPYRSDSRVKRKRTRINIDSEYERSRDPQPVDDNDDEQGVNGDNEDDDD